MDPRGKKMESGGLNQLDDITTKMESLLQTVSVSDIIASSSRCGKAKETLGKLYVSGQR